MENNKNKSYLPLALLSLFFGIAGGIGGEVLIRFYILKDLYKVPLFGEINVPENVYSGSNLIIDSPKKVVVEQNTKVIETLNSVNRNIFGIFNKIPISISSDNKNLSTSTKFNINENYNLNDYLGQGFVVTSDGWLVSSYIPTVLLENAGAKSASSTQSIKKELISKFTIINNEGRAYTLLDVVLDDTKTLSFWKVDAKDLGVRQFGKISDIKVGQLAIATNFKGTSLLTTILGKFPDKQISVFSSDKTYSKITLADDTNKNLGESFLFNIEGDLIALIENGNEIKPVGSFFSCLQCLFDKKNFTRAYLGINYVNLYDFTNPNTSLKYGDGVMVFKNEASVAVIKNSPADLAEIKEGDIIVAVNAIKINRDNNFSDVISEFNSGEKISLTIKRGLSDLQIAVSLGTRSEIDSSPKN